MMKKVHIGTILPLVILGLCLFAAGQAGSQYLDEQLLRAAARGDITEVQQLLQQGAHIEAKDFLGDTALINAAVMDHAEVVKLLLDKGANLEAKDRYDDTALILAAHKGVTEVVKLLLEKGANTNAKDFNGYTALIEAARWGEDRGCETAAGERSQY
jgi:ankyrin repeat protein